MADVIRSVIGSDLAVSPDTIGSICGALTLILAVGFIDFIKNIFFGFFRG